MKKYIEYAIEMAEILMNYRSIIRENEVKSILKSKDVVEFMESIMTMCERAHFVKKEEFAEIVDYFVEDEHKQFFYRFLYYVHAALWQSAMALGRRHFKLNANDLEVEYENILPPRELFIAQLDEKDWLANREVFQK